MAPLIINVLKEIQQRLVTVNNELLVKEHPCNMSMEIPRHLQRARKGRCKILGIILTSVLDRCIYKLTVHHHYPNLFC